MKNVLVLCTGNSCRSVMAEALINHLGGGNYKAVSAGSKPAGYVYPKSIETLKRHGIEAGHPRSKSWDEFAGQNFDLVITVCDAAASEACPVFFGNHEKLHWPTPDPAAATGSEADITAAFDEAFMILRNKVLAYLIAEEKDMATFIKSASYCAFDFNIEEAESLINKIGAANNKGDRERALKWGTQEHTNFYFEMVPLLKIAKHLREYDASKNIKLRFTGPEQEPHDGVMLINQTEYKVQSVAAVDGHQESLRLEYLNQKDVHFVKGMGNIEYEGTRNNREFKDNRIGIAVEIEGKDWNEYYRNIICAALKKKMKEKYKSHWLSITVDDSNYYALDEAPQPLGIIIKEVLHREKKVFNIFPKIFFSGMRTKLFLEFNSNDYL